METALLKGDRVLVNRMSYGIRMPITLWSIPFTFDSFFGMKSYSTSVQFDYRRVFESQVERNDIVLFNNPLETEKPLDKRSLCLSRCVAVPGDTITVEGHNYQINGKQYVTSPDFLSSYKFHRNLTDSIKSITKLLNIPFRNYIEKPGFGYASFNRYEAFLINQNLSDSLALVLDETESPKYKVLLPKRGMEISFDEYNLPIYANAILSEKGNDAKIENNKLYLLDVEVSTYTFQNDYYWFLSDNVNESVDSRYLGLISEKDVIGKASYIWYSSSSDGIRWDRFFSKVK